MFDIGHGNLTMKKFLKAFEPVRSCRYWCLISHSWRLGVENNPLLVDSWL